MRLDRNSGKGKYAIINLRKLKHDFEHGRMTREVHDAWLVLEQSGLVEFGEPGTEDEFFVLKLKDMAASVTLRAYADVYYGNGKDMDYGSDVMELARRAGPNSPWCKKPD